MKKKLFMCSIGRPNLRAGRHPATRSIVATMACAFLLTACTNYRPLHQGARVPWAAALVSTNGGPLEGNRYRVGEGDALSRIAERYDVRLSTLAAANNIQSPYILYPGEVLRVPVEAPIADRSPEIVQAALPPAEPLAPPTPSSWKRQTTPAPIATAPIEPPQPEVEGTEHVVASGESLSVIASRHDLTLGELVSVNDIAPPYRIKPGQKLIIPVTEAQRTRQVRDSQPAGVETSASMAPPPPLSDEGFLWPVDGEMIGNFENDAASGRSGGVNIAARKGTPVRAADNGIVAYAGEALSGYGQMVMLRHAEGYVTLYAHNDAILVREGDVVRRGQSIAEVGDSGDVSGSQLHFELRKGTAPIDPTEVLAGLPGRQIGGL